jgi:hypothetical protein
LQIRKAKIFHNKAAWHEATLMAGELFKDFDGDYRPGEEWNLDVTDQSGTSVCRIQITSQGLR